MKYGIVLILIGVAWCLGVKMRSVPVKSVALSPTPVETLYMAARTAEPEPMFFDHCNFESVDLLRAMREGQTVMITGSEIGLSTITIPKGKVVVFKILNPK